MAIQSEVKCGKCDRYYSVFRVHCPVCGARRGSQSKFAQDIDNNRGKYLITGALFLVLIIAVITLIALSGGEEEPPPVVVTSPSPTAMLPDDGNNITGPGTSPTFEPSAEPSATPIEEPTFEPPQPAVTSVEIQYNGRSTEDFTEHINKSIKLTVKITPADIDVKPVWSTSNPDVFDVVPDATGFSATVTITGRGDETLSVTVGDKTDTCIVRGRP